jgi:hypothetical protein
MLPLWVRLPSLMASARAMHSTDAPAANGGILRRRPERLDWAARWVQMHANADKDNGGFKVT